MNKTKSEKPDPVNLALLEKSAVEQAVPPYMMLLMAKTLIAGGIIIRKDIPHKLDNASAVPLAIFTGNDEVIRHCAKRVDDVSNKVLRVLNADQYEHGFYAVAMLCLVLVDEGYWDDPTNMAVLVSMVVLDDLKQFGYSGDYTFKEALLKMDAYKMLQALRKEELFDLQLTAQKLPKPTNNLSPGA